MQRELNNDGNRIRSVIGWASGVREAVVRSFAEFLAFPTCIIIAFLLLAAGSYLLDRANLAWLNPIRAMLRRHVFADPAGTADLLGSIAGSLITVTSITISLLLVALQQSASTMTAQVFDQFLRRKHNQFYFGFFIGLSLYALVTLATVSAPFNPVFGATLVFLLTAVALYLLLVLLYTTINQMRPTEIMDAIQVHVLRSRECHLDMIRKTRRLPLSNGPATLAVRTGREGYVTKIDVKTIGDAARKIPGGEVVLAVVVGSHVALDDVIATARAQTQDDADILAKLTTTGVVLERQRDITTDSAYGVAQLAMIAWTSVSTAKSNPSPGLHALHTLRGILARWSTEKEELDPEAQLPVVYADKGFEQLMDAFESLAVVSSESMQHQVFSEVLRTFSLMYARLPPAQQIRAEDLLRRILPAMGDHVLTRELDSALSALAEVLTGCGRSETASLVEQAQLKLDQSVGKLHSRSTRVGG